MRPWTRARSSATSCARSGCPAATFGRFRAPRDEALDWYRQEEPAAAAAPRSLDDPELRRRRVHMVLEWVRYDEVTGRWTEEITAARIALRDACALNRPVAVVVSGHNLARALIGTGHADEARDPLDLMVRHLERRPREVRARTERLAGRLCSHTDRNPRPCSMPGTRWCSPASRAGVASWGAR